MSAVQPVAGALASARQRRELAPLLAVAAPVALLAVALVVVSPGLVVQDSWLALVSGREVAEHGLPHVEHLTRIAGGRPWVDQQWLAQLVLYGAADIAGIGAAFAVCILATVTAFALVIHAAYRRGASPVSILLVLPLAVAAAPWGLQLRTQSLALPLFALVLWLLLRDPRAEHRSTLLVLPVLVLWANVHGSIPIGVGLVVAWALQSRTPRALPWLVLAPATVLVSPYATALPGYYRMMLLDPPFGRAIKEWEWTTPSILSATFFALAALSLVFVVRRRSRLNAFDALAFALAFAVGVDAMRGIVWFGLASLALLPPLVTRVPGAARLDGRLASAFVVAAGVAVAGAVALAGARPAHAYETRFPDGLAGVVASDRSVFADEATSDWLLWEIPSLRGRIAYDVRFEVLTRAQVDRLLVWRSFAPGWQSVPDGYSIVVDDPGHVSRLVATGRWRRVFAGGTFAVAERR